MNCSRVVPTALLVLLMAPAARAGLIITEIMYDPHSSEPAWEWVEVYNGGAAPVDLTGYVLDDNNNVAHGAANIAGGSIGVGQTGVLYNANLSAADFEAAWGPGINLIPVTAWGNLQLNNTGDTVGLWDSFASYVGDHVAHANVVEGVAFDDTGDWPSNDGRASIYLRDVAADNGDGANWAQSTAGAEGARTANAAGGNDGLDVGSPGTVPAIDLLLTGVVDGPITGGLPKAFELYALEDIGDLSLYGLESANNGSPSTGTPEFDLPAQSRSAGEYVYVSLESAEFTNFFGFAPDFTAGVASINGDDAVLLYKNGVVVDVFGVVGTDGTGELWEYTDGWAYRRNGTGPDGDTFVPGNWLFSGRDALDGETSNATAAVPFPIGTYSAVPEPATALLVGAGLIGAGGVRRPRAGGRARPRIAG